jgi:integrase
MKARKLIWATAEGKKCMSELAARYKLDLGKDRQKLLERMLEERPEGSLAKSAWLVVYAVSGKRYQRTFPKKKDADAWITTAQLDVRNGAHVPDSTSLTVREAGEQWIEACKNGAGEERPALERSTWEQYRQHLEHHIYPYLGDIKLSRLTPQTVRDFMTKLAAGTPPPGADHAEPRSRAMLKKIRTSLGSLLAESGTPRNVVHEMRRARSKAHVEKRHEDDLEIGVDIPTPDEISAIIKTLDGDEWRRWRPLILTAIFTGLRSSELRGMRWKYLDLVKGAAHVRQRADRYGTFGPPKSGAGRRSVPLTPKLVAALKEWRLACPKGKLDLVFPNGVGKVESHSNIINRCWHPLQIAAGVADVEKDADGNVVYGEDAKPVRKPRYSGLHALRHFYASWCINSEPAGLGLPPKAVQTRLGHSSIVMTMDVYGHLFPGDEHSEKAAEGEARLWG